MVNHRIKQLLPSSTLAITARAKELKSQGVDVVNFAAGEPDYDTPEDIKKAAIEAIKGGFTKYTPSVGTVELREAIAQKLKRDNFLDYKPNQIAVGCGAKHSIFNVIQVLADDGDDVLIPSPFWVSYPEMVKVAGATPVFIPTSPHERFKLTPALLKKYLTKKSVLLILNSPSNPTGVLYSRSELAALAAICVERKIWMLSDEIYEKLIYDTSEYVSVAAISPEAYAQTITINGLSKAYSMTGWRIGYCAGPQSIIDHVKNFQDHTTSNPTSISQMAALQALKSADTSIVVMRDEFRKRRDLMLAGMDKVPGVTYTRPDGAFYLFCDFSHVGQAADVAKRVLDEARVAVIPGDGFGAPGHLRLSFSTSQERIKEGTQRLADWVKKNRL